MKKDNDPNFLDLAKVFSGEVPSFSFSLPVPGEEEAGGMALSDFAIEGKAVNVSGFLRISGTASCTLSAPCGRCLAPVQVRHTVPFDRPVVKTASDDESEDAVLCEGEKIDPALLCLDTVLPELPLRLLCREDCKGLCPRCGKDRNAGPCGCPEKEVDPRLAGLAGFFESEK